MGVVKNFLAAALTLIGPKSDFNNQNIEAKNINDVKIENTYATNSPETNVIEFNQEKINSNRDNQASSKINDSEDDFSNPSTNEQKFKVTSSETVGRISRDSFASKAGNYIRSGGLGYLGALAENAPTLLKAGVTGVALYNVLDKAFGSSKKHGSLMKRVSALGQKFAEGQLTSQAIGEKMQFDTKTFILAAIAFSGGGQMQQVLSQATGMNFGASESSGIGGR